MSTQVPLLGITHTRPAPCLDHLVIRTYKSAINTYTGPNKYTLYIKLCLFTCKNRNSSQESYTNK